MKHIKGDIDYINYHCQKRGPDLTNIVEINGITFIHNLLNITGDPTKQPFVDTSGDVVCLFNGEVYNYKKFNKRYKSDGECLLDLYREFGYEFVKKLDGEFAICLVDFSKGVMLLSTDVFSTKPLFYSFDNEENNFMVSSYPSCIERNGMKNICKLEANKTVVYGFDGFDIVYESTVYDFDLNQHKNTYDDWVKMFEAAVLKRAMNVDKRVFVSLSSGYDSGAICCVLNKYNIPYTTYTITGKENRNVLNKRFELNKCESKIYNFDKKLEKEEKERIVNNCCDYEIEFIRNRKYSVFTDKASIGGSFIYGKSRENDDIINLSGQGADEILADYGFRGRKIKSHSYFGGKFPRDLSKIFPWGSFFSGIGQCLLMKEEIIGGSHGIENRYPFLDRDLVQEFLWLDSNLKNRHYKGPLTHYLQTNNYPFKFEKIGFNSLYK